MADEPDDVVEVDDDLETEEGHSVPLDDADIAQDDESDPDPDDAAVYAFGDEADDEGDGDPKNLVTILRERQRIDAREKQKLREENESLKAKLPSPVEELGPRPTAEDCGWDDEELADKMADWLARKSKIEGQRSEQQRAAEASQAAWQNEVTEFYTKAQELKIPNLKDIEQSVSDAFGDDMAGQNAKAILIKSKDPRLIAALASSPTKLAELVAMKGDLVSLAIAVGELKGKTVKRNVPKPETVLRGQAPIANAGDKHMAKLEAEASRTGDRSKIIAYKAKQMESE